MQLVTVLRGMKSEKEKVKEGETKPEEGPRAALTGYWINRLAHHLQGLPSGMGGAGPTAPPSPSPGCSWGGLPSPGPARLTPSYHAGQTD